jgi:hypothetical protein
MGRGGAGALFSAIHRDEVLLLFTMEEGKGAIYLLTLPSMLWYAAERQGCRRYEVQ